MGRELARRLERERDATLLRTSTLGGVLGALVVDEAALDEAVVALEQTLRDFVHVRGHDVWPVVTIGLRACTDGEDPIAVVADVRDTLFAALDRAPGRTRWHDRLIGYQQARQFREVGELARALHHDPAQFGLAFQPVLDLQTGEIVGAEALLRWTHPVHGPLSPVTTIANAERSGLVHELGLLVLERALQQAAAWQAAGCRRVRMHVNVTASQLREPSFVDDVVVLLRDHALPPDGLLLELTETDLMADELSIRPALFELRDLGVRIGIDDFGTGFSSIARLHQLPVDAVKIDRSLVSGIAHSPAAFDLARAVLGLLSTRPVDVVAEGIENAVEAAHLRALGCRLGQGFHLGRPTPADQFPWRTGTAMLTP